MYLDCFVINDIILDLRLYWIVDLIESSWAMGEDRIISPFYNIKLISYETFNKIKYNNLTFNKGRSVIIGDVVTRINHHDNNRI